MDKIFTALIGSESSKVKRSIQLPKSSKAPKSLVVSKCTKPVSWLITHLKMSGFEVLLLDIISNLDDRLHIAKKIQNSRVGVKKQLVLVSNFEALASNMILFFLYKKEA
jgi:hypothetical protein